MSIMNSSGLLGTHAGFMFRDRPNERSFIERCYAPLVPGCDERLFDPLGGLLVVEVGESDGIDTAVRLEDGRYTPVSPKTHVNTCTHNCCYDEPY
jgi:hypothetical protein